MPRLLRSHLLWLFSVAVMQLPLSERIGDLYCERATAPTLELESVIESDPSYGIDPDSLRYSYVSPRGQVAIRDHMFGRVLVFDGGDKLHLRAILYPEPVDSVARPPLLRLSVYTFAWSGRFYFQQVISGHSGLDAAYECYGLDCPSPDLLMPRGRVASSLDDSIVWVSRSTSYKESPSYLIVQSLDERGRLGRIVRNRLGGQERIVLFWDVMAMDVGADGCLVIAHRPIGVESPIELYRVSQDGLVLTKAELLAQPGFDGVVRQVEAGADGVVIIVDGTGKLWVNRHPEKFLLRLEIKGGGIEPIESFYFDADGRRVLAFPYRGPLAYVMQLRMP